ncbi:MAG: methylenetetrahydrofolate reductase [Phycisphaerae bacterium]|nr:methylenetetrahydrofolate reductase [Phycisphaerae bacterium]
MLVKKISDIFDTKPRTLSFEFFPPKTDKGRDNLFAAAEKLMELQPDFFSVTYGAGGSTSKSTLDIVQELQRRHDIPVMHHFTCTKHSRVEIREQLNEMMASDIHNIMALRGDPPADEPHYEPGPDEPRYAFELIKIIRERAGWFTVGVAAFPEGHLDTPTKELDSLYTRVKQDVGADFAITQVFFETELYRQFADRMAAAGITMRLIPGILPITNYQRLCQFCETCGATVSPGIHDTFSPLADDLDATGRKGIEVVTEQCRTLLALGAPGLHFYCLNKPEPVTTIHNALGDWRA